MSRLISLVALACALPATACGGARGPTSGATTAVTPESPGAPPDAAAAAAGAFLERSFAGETGGRTYRLYVPAGHDGRHEAPLIVMLHGCTQDAQDFAVGTRMNRWADEHGFLVAYPEQPASEHPQKCWNWYEPAHQRRGRGEPAVIAGITRELMRQHRIDARRVYVAGISAGGAMSVVLAATYPELYAAAASHSGIAYGAARGVAEALAVMRGEALDARAAAEAARAALDPGARAIPLLVFHGADDPVVRPSNADALAVQWALLAGTDPAAARDERVRAGGREAVRTLFRDEAGRVRVERWLVQGLAHAWSGGDAAGSYADPLGPDASREIVRFFLEHPRPEQ